MKILVISGTPGTGKTSVAKRISELISVEVISLNELVISKNFTLKYDEKRETQVIDIEKILPYIIEQINRLKTENIEYLIIEGHFADIIPDEIIDYAFILRCDPDELSKRLNERGYKKAKIRENLQSEILANSANFMVQKQIKSPIYEIDTSKHDLNTVAEIIIDIIMEKSIFDEYSIGQIDWLEILSETDRLKEFFD
jgi:adenylate kinase